MKNKLSAQHKSAVAQALLLVLAVFLSAVSAHAGEKVIFQFNGNQGVNPSTGLISDTAGNFYGTISGGIGNCFNVYELSPGSSGTYTETILYTFQNCNSTALYPVGGLSIDNNGNLYGAEATDLNDGSGQIYELAKGTNGSWIYSVIHTFGSKDGSPYGDLAWDAAGNLYGATQSPFTTSNGEVFKLSPQSDGSWKEGVLYKFPSPNGVGSPSGSVVLDSQGNLYGATYLGYGGDGSNTRGGVYELSPQSGTWKLTLLYNFTTASASQFPNSRLTLDSSGNLYGTTQGGKALYGTVYEVSPASGGTWTEQTLHTFTAGKNDGGYTNGNLVFDASGNLYGATYNGGSGCNANLCGVVYKLTPQSGGGYKESIAHTFESASDGSQPYSGLFLDSSGNLYGTTYHGGSRYGYGTVYEITP
ncbi:MAG: choice-of-anchor tandem repeat GloVer-containing protein [Candidatus Sulfotelmatobacter sp.]